MALAACSLAPAGHQRCASCGPISRDFWSELPSAGGGHIVSPHPGRQLVIYSQSGLTYKSDKRRRASGARRLKRDDVVQHRTLCLSSRFTGDDRSPSTAIVKICFMELITSWHARGARHPDNNQIILQRMAGAPRDWTRRSQITRYLLADIAL